MPVDEIAVVRIELDLAVARTGGQAPAWGQLPGADQVGFAAFDAVEFVALQAALAAELVGEALAAFTLIIPAQARSQRYRQLEQLGVALPADFAAAKATVQLDHAAAGIQRVASEGEKLLHVAFATVDHHRDLIVVGQPAPVVQPQLLMADALAGVESLGLRDRLLAVGAQRVGR